MTHPIRGLVEHGLPSLLPALMEPRCNDDRACELRCPERAIRITDVPAGGRIWDLAVARCSGCGICLSACPERALVAHPRTTTDPRVVRHRLSLATSAP
jgi:Pyruvate/2-oxoacid:ferredoxin oxidoreductase delta subunit